MSNILLSVQDAVLASINNNENIKNNVSGVFTHVPANSKFPYIVLGKMELKDKSCKTNNYFDAYINIMIYSKDRNYKMLFSLVDEVRNSISIENFTKAGFAVFSLVYMSCEIEQKQDGVTSIANLKYKLSIGG